MKTLTAGVLAAIDDATVRPVLWFETEFDSSTLRLSETNWDMAYTGDAGPVTYLGNGWFKGFSAVRENLEAAWDGVTVTLTGVASSLISLVLGQTSEYLIGTLYLVLLDANEDIIADPIIMFRGYLDIPAITLDPESSEITLSYENLLSNLSASKDFRYTKESQALFFTGDLGFDYVPSLQDWEFVWYRPKGAKQIRHKNKNKDKR